jgi:hypothetical protein
MSARHGLRQEELQPLKQINKSGKRLVPIWNASR